MKSFQAAGQRGRTESRPARGGWIEMLRASSITARGGWIEITKTMTMTLRLGSRPARGGWIEIFLRPTSLPRHPVPPRKGRVD